MKNFTVKSNGLEFMVSAKDWYNAIQVAYEMYLSKAESTELISYMKFREHCSVNITE